MKPKTNKKILLENKNTFHEDKNKCAYCGKALTGVVRVTCLCNKSFCDRCCNQKWHKRKEW
jgi:hypothetical protein